MASACGFTPLHSLDERSKFALEVESVNISIDTHAPSAQFLKAELEQQINPRGERAEKLFNLNIKFVETQVDLFINPDGTSGRGDYRFNSAYTLSRVFDGKVIDTGVLDRVSSFNNAQTADFSTFISREDARRRGIQELAQDYKLRLANLLPKINNPVAQPPSRLQTPKTDPQEMRLRDRMSNSLDNTYENNIPGF